MTALARPWPGSLATSPQLTAERRGGADLAPWVKHVGEADLPELATYLILPYSNAPRTTAGLPFRRHRVRSNRITHICGQTINP